ncbi:MAG: hypothetical protein SV775_07020, partial [Thermodesulfobacteriota bacterium]|nr:hypothetical protein [Thermodesulfobacteriota bacterium]
MNKRVGDILVGMGFIDKDQIELAVTESRKTGTMLGEVLVRLDWVTEEQLQMAIAAQSGAQVLDTRTVNVDQSLTARIPQDFAVRHNIFPLGYVGSTINVATTNPFDVITRDELARMTGSPIAAFMASKDWVTNAIRLYYNTSITIDNDIESITHTGRAEWAS